MTPRRLDVAELKGRVSLAAVVGESLPLRRAGPEYVALCPFHKEQTPSFHVVEAKGFYHCFGCGANGDALSFVQKHLGLSFRDAALYLAARAGVTLHETQMPAKRSQKAVDTERRNKVIAWAWRVWEQTLRADGTPAEAYLRGRGIDTDKLGGMPADLHFHRGLKDGDSGGVFPAMVGAIRGPDGHFQGVHRTFLAGDGDRVVKAPIARPKKMAGVAKAGVLRLAPAGPTLAVAEGIETGLSVMQSAGLPCWAALSLGNFQHVVFPPEVHEAVLCADNDSKDPAQAERVLAAAVRAWEAQGVAVRVARPPPGMDFNDVLRRQAAG